MKINGWIKASNQWKKDVPQPVAILMNYSLEPGRACWELSFPHYEVTNKGNGGTKTWLSPHWDPAFRGVRLWQVWGNYLHIVDIVSYVHILNQKIRHRWYGLINTVPLCIILSHNLVRFKTNTNFLPISKQWKVEDCLYKQNKTNPNILVLIYLLILDSLVSLSLSVFQL